MAERAVRLHLDAEAELEAAYEWYAQRDVILAGRFLEQFRVGCQLIGERPGSYPLDEGASSAIRYYQFKKFPYLILFREEDEVIQIIAVAHTACRPGYWQGRLED